MDALGREAYEAPLSAADAGVIPWPRKRPTVLRTLRASWIARLVTSAKAKLISSLECYYLCVPYWLPVLKFR